MFKKKMNLGRALSKSEQKQVNGGQSEPPGITVMCSCGDGTFWEVGTAHNEFWLDVFRGQCQVDGGTPREW